MMLPLFDAGKPRSVVKNLLLDFLQDTDKNVFAPTEVTSCTSQGKPR
jgi:hypothetical protein